MGSATKATSAATRFTSTILLSGMCRLDTPIQVSWSRQIDYRRATGIGVSGARMAGRPKVPVS